MNFIEKIILRKFLKGKKTYLVAIAAGGVLALQLMNVVDPETANSLYKILGVTGLVTLKAGMKK